VKIFFQHKGVRKKMRKYTEKNYGEINKKIVSLRQFKKIVNNPVINGLE
jgi:hypothetical protein